MIYLKGCILVLIAYLILITDSDYKEYLTSLINEIKTLDNDFQNISTKHLIIIDAIIDILLSWLGVIFIIMNYANYVYTKNKKQ